MAFTYYTPVTIDHTKCGGSDSSNFTVLFNTVDARFKTVANGGHVQNSSGFDIRPYSDSGLTTALNFELERYNASTGEVVMWIKEGTVSHTSDTVYYLAYGDSSLSTDGSSTSAWDSTFTRVYHLKDGTTLSVIDSTGIQNGTNSGATATSGQIDGAANFAAVSSQKITAGNLSQTAITVSLWINDTLEDIPYRTAFNMGASSVSYAGIDVKSNGKLNVAVQATTSRAYDGTGTHTLSAGTWYHVALTYDSSAGLVAYVNAASDGTVSANGNMNSTSQPCEIGHSPAFNCCFWNGKIDEVHVANVARSADWITTEYNNQNSPSTFYTVGTEITFGGVNAAAFFRIF
jgi:hypothetical protein